MSEETADSRMIPLVVQGKHYESIRAFCRKTGMKYTTACNRRRKNIEPFGDKPAIPGHLPQKCRYKGKEYARAQGAMKATGDSEYFVYKDGEFYE